MEEIIKMEYVEVKNLRVKYKTNIAVRDISFSMSKGSILGFIGPNGAGKTSTIRVLATLIRPASGKVVVAGHSITSHPVSIRRKVGYMPDSFGVYHNLTVYEYLDFFAAAFGMNYRERRSTIVNALHLTDIAEKKSVPVDELSRGMKQRVSLARLLLHDPEVLLLDEPASGLDPRARIEIRELFKALNEMGKTILISSHILSELSRICTSICIIEAGRLVATGPLDEIFRTLDLARMVHVQITNLNRDMTESIRRIQGVESVEAEPDRLSLNVKEGKIKMEDLLTAIQNTGACVSMYQPQALDLETAFMKLTKGELQ